jgi:hypothetical protein
MEIAGLYRPKGNVSTTYPNTPKKKGLFSTLKIAPFDNQPFLWAVFLKDFT